MKTLKHNKTSFVAKTAITLVTLSVSLAAAGLASAQTLEQIRWKGEDKVREILGV